MNNDISLLSIDKFLNLVYSKINATLEKYRNPRVEEGETMLIKPSR